MEEDASIAIVTRSWKQGMTWLSVNLLYSTLID